MNNMLEVHVRSFLMFDESRRLTCEDFIYEQKTRLTDCDLDPPPSILSNFESVESSKKINLDFCSRARTYMMVILL